MSTSLLLGLAAGTLVSEDLASISAGLLAREGAVGLLPAIGACAAGVYVGDLGLWALGRVVGRRGLQCEWAAGRIRAASLELGGRLDDNIAGAVLASRFLPGSRLPMYLAVGACGRRPWAFAAWSLVGVLLWTPPLVWLAHTLGAAATTHLVGGLTGALRPVVAAVCLFTAWTLVTRALRRRGSVINERACEAG